MELGRPSQQRQAPLELVGMGMAELMDTQPTGRTSVCGEARRLGCTYMAFWLAEPAEGSGTGCSPRLFCACTSADLHALCQDVLLWAETVTGLLLR